MIVPAEGTVLERILDAAHAVANTGLGRAAYGRLEAAQTRTAWARDHRRRVALMEGDAWRASAKQYRLAGILDGRPLRVCGIGELLTAPGAGESDPAGALAERLLEDAARDGAEIALLFSARDTAWCERHRFETLPTVEVELEVAQSPRHGAPMTLVRAGEERDLPAIVAIGQARAAGFRFHLDRDADLVQYAITAKRLLSGLGKAGARELQFFVAEEGVAAVAYVVLTVVGSTWTIEECGDRDLPGARVGAILQALIARDPGAPRPAIRGWLPPGFRPPQVTVKTAQPSTEVVRVRMLGPTIDPKLNGADVLYWHGDIL